MKIYPILLTKCFKYHDLIKLLEPAAALAKPLRINIEGPLTCVEKLIPGIKWNLDIYSRPFLQPAGPELAKLAFKHVYGRQAPNDLPVTDEYLG
ncbi:hypothetical protein PT974_10340 [Cladobotryum mycophilum]|uniref:Uncharacterized protein n=1 Tax=Cladobotryum mycophilum TaxID=491253 RepID=A0ABR0S9K3_9HYPO